MSEPDFTASIGIVGLGLIGGSIGLALREPGVKILGCDLSEQHEKIAKQRFCVDSIEPFEKVVRAEIVFVAVPPNALVSVCERACCESLPQTVITDCGSVKAEVAAWATRSKVTNFVPGHPMAGHERSGPEYASAWLFRGARWLLTPTKSTSKSMCLKLERLLKKIGANPLRLEPEEHDRHVAVLSHLPHVLAGALIEEASPLEHKEVGAGSWRDLTRVAGVDPNLWAQILYGNRVELARSIEEMEGSLRKVRELLAEDSPEQLRKWLTEIQKIKTTQTSQSPEPGGEKPKVVRAKGKRPKY